MKKEFDYYIYIDYSKDLIGYTIIEKSKIKELLPKISRFRHYRKAREKKLYLKNVKNTFKREKLLDYFLKTKVTGMWQNLDIFSEVIEFLKNNSNCIIFISVDDKQYSSFEKLVKMIDIGDTKIINESELRKGTFEYQISLVLDNWINIERLKNEN